MCSYMYRKFLLQLVGLHAALVRNIANEYHYAIDLCQVSITVNC